MNRVLWVLGEIVVGVLLAGSLTAVAVPVLMRGGWDASPLAGALALATGIVLSVVVGERLRKSRQDNRLS